MNTSFRTRVARDTDGLPWTFAGARIGLRALAAADAAPAAEAAAGDEPAKKPRAPRKKKVATA